MRQLASVLLVTLVVAGCGTQPMLAPMSVAGPSVMARQTAQAAVKLDQRSVEKGKADAAAKLSGKSKATFGPTLGYDQNAYAYGYAMGLLTGTLNTFNRVEGNFDVREWKSFSYNLRNGMADALKGLQSNRELASKYAGTIGILQGGIRAFDSINGSFDVTQWKSFAYSNKSVLEQALRSLDLGPQG